MNKPLTKERREEIARDYADDHMALEGGWVADLLSEATYWREAVKKVFQDQPGECPFCGMSATTDAENFKIRAHFPDCPWLLAQD